MKGLDGLPKAFLLGFVIPGAILDAWYARGENPESVIEALRAVGLPNSYYMPGIRLYMHLIGGQPREDFPEPARRFLAESPPLVVPMLRAFVQTCMNVTSEIQAAGTIDVPQLEAAAVLYAMTPLLTPAQRVPIEEVETRLPIMVISPAVAERARRYLDSGEVLNRHPAHAFLNKLLAHAEVSVSLPQRAKALANICG